MNRQLSVPQPFLLLCIACLLAFPEASAQPTRPVRPPERISFPVLVSTDNSDCPDCSSEDIRLLSEVLTRYQGMKGTNPSAPSTFNLIGKHKFSGSIYNFTNDFFGENWYPIRTEKQILTGTFHDFSVANFGDESDWNINLLPDNGFEDFVADAIPYRQDNWYASADWPTTEDGKVLIEAEITPDERRYGNPWFSNNEGKSPLVNKKISAYGPFLREEAHGNHPEIHPCEQLWWTEGDGALTVLLLVDDSNRFKKRADTVVTVGDHQMHISGDFTARRATTFAYQPWALEKGQEAELSIAFAIDPAKASEYMSIQALDALDLYSGASYPDVSEGDKHTLTYKGNAVLTVQEASPIAPFVGVTFRNVCFNRATGKLQGYVVLKTAIGNGDGKEGFVALRIDKKNGGVNAKPTLLTGDLGNTWKVHGFYDDQVAFSDVISSDMHGRGIVNGLMDFNGNGKTDLFAKKGDQWLVLYDAKGTWQELNTSSIPVEELRFGDVNGDGKTDILRVGPHKKVLVSYGGTGQWTELTDAGEQNQYIQVGDFNGDGKTDLVYLKYTGAPPATPVWHADMYVKYGCTGPWKKLNNNYNLLAADDYYKNFRFGHFNGDKITDIFRYLNGRFVVYYGGTGDFKELCKPAFPLKAEDLLFVDNETMPNSTDVIYVDPNTKKWTVFYGGKPGSLPLTIDYGDPVNVRFGDLDADPAVEPIAVDLRDQPVAPTNIVMTTVERVSIEPSFTPRYVPGSLKRVQANGKPSLTASFNLRYYPGTTKGTRSRERAPEIRGIKEMLGSRALHFKTVSAMETQTDEVQTIGQIEDVPLSGATENHLQMMVSSRPTPATFKTSAYAITGVPNKIEETVGSAGNWDSWKRFLSSTVNDAKTPLLGSGPGSPAQIEKVKFELVPLYSSLEEKKVTLVEMDDVSKELNEIAYGTNKNRIKEIFGEGKAFTISWAFELRDMTTGQNIPLQNPSSLSSDGKWPKSKVSFQFPLKSDLLQLKATATVKDQLGNSTVAPMEFVFWNQRIGLSHSDEELEAWLKPLKGNPAIDYEHLLTKAKYLGEDNVLTPAEVASLLH